ncbi:MAG: NUDIX domain-containing protein [Mollicutes bacterium]|nr:NUDIX domain-containing protein [Mollicutes bacterium]
MKQVRKAVRTFLINDNKVIVIKYKTNKNMNYYDIPGGKVEENESAIDASIREFKEETGIEVINQKYKGNVIIEYPNMVFDFDIYLVNDYKGNPQEFDENYSMWINIEDLLSENKKFPSVEIIKYLENNDINLKIYSDDNHNILNIE